MVVSDYIKLLQTFPPNMDVIIFDGVDDADATGPVIERYTQGKCGWSWAESNTPGAQNVVVLR